MPRKKVFKHKKLFGKKKMVTTIQKVIRSNAEQKWRDTEVTAFPVYAGTPYSVSMTSLIAQAAQNNNRVGDRIRLQHLYVRLYVAIPAASDSVCRVIIWRSKLNSALQSIAAQGPLILKNSNIGTALEVVNEYEMSRIKDRVIIYDSGVHQPPNSIGGNYILNKTVNLKNSLLAYDTNSLDGVGHVGVLVVSDSVIGTHATMYATFRVTYTDE